MKANINGINLDGTPEEFKSFFTGMEVELPEDTHLAQAKDIVAKRDKLNKDIRRTTTKFWTNEEEEKLKSLSKAGHIPEQIARMLGRTICAVKAKWYGFDFGRKHKKKSKGINPDNCKRKRTSDKRRNKQWTKAEDKELTELYNAGKSYKYMARHLKRTIQSVKTRTSNLKLKRRFLWTPEDKKQLLFLWNSGYTPKYIAKHFGRTQNAIRTAMSVYFKGEKKKRYTGSKSEVERLVEEETAKQTIGDSVRKRKKHKRKVLVRKTWNQEEDDKLIGQVTIGTSLNDIAKMMNRSFGSVMTRLCLTHGYKVVNGFAVKK